MNIIDKKFNDLCEEIKLNSEKEIYNHIKEKFSKVSPTIQKSCIKFFNDFPYWGNILDDSYFIMKASAFKNHINDFIWLYENLEDYQSKKVLFSILDNWYNYNDLESVIQKIYDDYFDLDLVKCDNEVLVDLGAYIGDSTISFINNYLDYKKIYCFEIDKENIKYLKTNLKDCPNIDIVQKGVSDKDGFMYLNKSNYASAHSLKNSGDEKVEVVTLDSYIKEKITIIKSDIEGLEIKALKGSKNHIINDHPKLLISIYHSNTDIFEIPKLIKSYDNSYKFYIRYHGGYIYPTEITLIAL